MSELEDLWLSGVEKIFYALALRYYARGQVQAARPRQQGPRVILLMVGWRVLRSEGVCLLALAGGDGCGCSFDCWQSAHDLDRSL